MTSIDTLATWVLSQAAARSHRVLQRHLGAAGVSGYEYRILSALASGDALNQTELGRRAALDRSDVTIGVRQLDARGLLERHADPAHGRRILITITATGTTAWTKAQRAVLAAQDDVFAELDESERQTLRALLGRVATQGAAAP